MWQTVTGLRVPSPSFSSNGSLATDLIPARFETEIRPNTRPAINMATCPLTRSQLPRNADRRTRLEKLAVRGSSWQTVAGVGSLLAVFGSVLAGGGRRQLPTAPHNSADAPLRTTRKSPTITLALSIPNSQFPMPYSLPPSSPPPSPQQKNRPHASTSARSTGVAGCYGPLSGIYCINESAHSMPVFRASVKKFFSASPQGVEPHALSYAWSRPPSVIPAEAGIKGCQEPAPIRCRRAPETRPECIQTCTNHAPNVHWWCVSKTSRTLQNRPPAIEGRHSRGGGNPGGVKTGPDSVQTGPRNAPGVHSKLQEPCTKSALVVRFEDFTHPTKQTTGD